MTPCGSCGGKTSSHGSRQAKLPALSAEGRVVWSERQVARRLCGSCGRSSTMEDAQVVSLRQAARDLAVLHGMTGAARRLGCEERFVRRLMRDWVAVREGDVPGFRPRVLSLVSVKTGRAEATLILDGDTPSLLDIRDDPDGTRAWIANRVGDVDQAVVGLDPRCLNLVRETLPGTDVLVPPSVSATAVRSASLDTARRHLATRKGGRNFRETLRLLHVPDEALTHEERDEIGSFWSRPMRALRRHALSLLQVLSAGNRSSFEGQVGATLEFLNGWMPGSRFEDLLSTWGDPMGRGSGQAWLDVVWKEIDGFVRRIVDRHGLCGVDLLRATFVFAEGPRGREGGLALSLMPTARPG